MLVHIPDHFSSKFRFNLNKTRCSAIDRSSVIKSVSGLILGVLMLGLGFFELYSFLKASKISQHSFVMVEIFSVIVIIISFGIISNSLKSLVRYKKLTFNGDSFSILYKPTFGIKHSFDVKLSEYIGVRLRVLFTQLGPFSINRYIIDLYNDDSNKIIPLYISFNKRNIRNIWEDYAKFFELPALSVGERGIIKRDYNDLNKSIIELSKEEKLPFIASGKFPNPDSIEIEETRNSTIIKQQKSFTKMFKFIALYYAFAIACVFLLTTLYQDFYFASITSIFIKLLLLFIALLGTYTIFFFLAKPSNSIEITDNKILFQQKIFDKKQHEVSINTDMLKDIVLSYNPKKDKYNLVFISDKKISFNIEQLPVNDLVWLKDFIIRKLIGN